MVVQWKAISQWPSLTDFPAPVLWDSTKSRGVVVSTEVGRGRRSRAPRAEPAGDRVALLQTAVADGILARLDEIVPKARRHILEEQPAYRNMTPAEVEDVTG